MTDVRLAQARLAAFPIWLGRRRAVTVIAVLIAASFLRCGFVIWNWFALSPKLLTEWARPENAFQSNVVFNAVGWTWKSLIGEPDGPLWLVTQVGLTVAGLALITWLVYRATQADSDYLAIAVLLTTGVATVLWREIGRYDVFFLVPIAAALLARRTWIWVAALIIAALSAPEQALLASLTLLGLTLLGPFTEWRRRAAWFLGLAIAAAVIVQVWFTATGHPYSTRIGVSIAAVTGQPLRVPSRFDLTQSPVQLTIEKFYQGLANGPGLIWSYLGAATLVLILIALTLRRTRSVVWLLIVLVAFPLFTTLFFGEDPTRDLAIVVTPALILLCIVGSRVFAELTAQLPGGTTAWAAWAAVGVTVLPTLYFFVQPEAPFSFAVHMLTSWNNGTPIDWTGNTR